MWRKVIHFHSTAVCLARVQTHVLLVTPLLHQSPEERDQVVDILHVQAVTELPHARTDYTMALCQNIFTAVAAFEPLLDILVHIFKIPWYIFYQFGTNSEC